MGTKKRRTICIGCGALIKPFNSPFGVCASCNPSRYDLLSDTEVAATPKGKYKIAEPLPYVDRPSALVICAETGRGAVFDPKEVGVWGIRPFRTYKGLHPSTNRGTMSLVTPSLLVRVWGLVTWKLGLR